MSTQLFDDASPALAVALTVRFLLELALLAGAAYLAWTTVPGWGRWPVAALAVVVIGVVWGLFLSPKAAIVVHPAAALVLEAALFVGVGAALAFATPMLIPAVIGVVVWAVDRVALAALTGSIATH